MFADAGAIAWLDYDGDGQQVEFVEYTDDAGQRLHRRKIKAEKVGTVFPVWKVHLVREATVLARADFDAGPILTWPRLPRGVGHGVIMSMIQISVERRREDRAILQRL